MSKSIDFTSPFGEEMNVRKTVNGSFEFDVSSRGIDTETFSCTLSKEDAMKLCDWIITNVT